VQVQVGVGFVMDIMGMIGACCPSPANRPPDWNAIDTVLLDLDGTLLDLAFDNYVWMGRIPELYAQANGLSVPEAQAALAPKFRALGAARVVLASTSGAASCRSTSRSAPRGGAAHRLAAGRAWLPRDACANAASASRC
jgi:hypothetical protein